MIITITYSPTKLFLSTLILYSVTIQTSSFSYISNSKPRAIKNNLPRHSFAQPLSSTILSEEWTTKTKDESISSLATSYSKTVASPVPTNNFISEDVFTKELLPVISAAFLITANTIGPSMMVVPNTVAGPGLFVSGLMLFGVWGINLMSALLVTEVAINYEASSNRNEIPSSFKKFAEINLQNKAAGVFVSFLCIFINWCVVSFNLMKMGEIAVANMPELTSSAPLLSLLYSLTDAFSMGGVEGDMGSSLPSTPDPMNIAASVFAIFWMGLAGTQSTQCLSGVASICCLGLFASFASILLPGLMNIQSNPLHFDTFNYFGQLLEPDSVSVLLGALPVFISVMIFQNIVPTVVKLLNYDRVKCVQAMVLGSALPLMMHLTFSYAVLGGGINLDLSTGGPLVNIFSIISVVGSTIACIMSLAGEFDGFFRDDTRETEESNDDMVEAKSDDVASMPSVVLAVLPPLFAGIYFSGGEEFVQAISTAGSFASPLLYGVIPVILAFNQRREWCMNNWGNDGSRELNGEESTSNMEGLQVGLKENVFKSTRRSQKDFKELAPGGELGLGLLVVASISFILERAMMNLSFINM